MSNYINIVQEPVSTTSPQVTLVQPYILKAQNYYDDWGFNLVNGKTGLTVYQKGNTVSDGTGGKSVILGDSNSVTGSNDNVIVIGNHLTYSKENGVAIGQYNKPAYPDNITPDLLLAIGTSDVDRYNAILAYKAGVNHILQIGDNKSSFVLIPILHLDNTEEFMSTRNLLVKSDANATYEPILTGAKLAAVISGIDSTKVAQIATNKSDIDAIEEKIPAEASSSNKLVDAAKANNDYVSKNKVNQGNVLYGQYYDSVLNKLVDFVKTYSTLNSAGVIVMRDNDGEIIVGTGTPKIYSAVSRQYVDNAILAAVSSVYRYKGSVASYDDLPSSDLTVGDVYNVEDTGDNYAWTGTTWDKLAGIIDLSGYVQKTTTIAGIALSSNISAQSLTEALNYDVDQDAVDYIMGVA